MDDVKQITLYSSSKSEKRKGTPEKKKGNARKKKGGPFSARSRKTSAPPFFSFLGAQKIPMLKSSPYLVDIREFKIDVRIRKLFMDSMKKEDVQEGCVFTIATNRWCLLSRNVLPRTRLPF